MSNGVVSDTSWRCTDDQPAGDAWKSAGFDDSGWSAATTAYYEHDFTLDAEQEFGALNIWASCLYNCLVVYCRKRL